MKLPPESRVRQPVTLDVGDGNGVVGISVSADANGFNDKVERTLKVVPKGFPIHLYSSGILKYAFVALTRKEKRWDTKRHFFH